MKIENGTVERYGSTLIEPYRPPSRGGNTGAWHVHFLTIAGETYSFKALGTKQWVFKGDIVSFEWEWSADRSYRNINPDTLYTLDKRCKPVARGITRLKKVAFGAYAISCFPP